MKTPPMGYTLPYYIIITISFPTSNREVCGAARSLGVVIKCDAFERGFIQSVQKALNNNNLLFFIAHF